MELREVDPASIIAECKDRFDKIMNPYHCIRVLAAVEGLETSGVSKCSLSSMLPGYRHIMNFTSGCDFVELTYLQYGVPPLMLLCFVGNMLNLLIYGLPYFDGSSSVHFLRAKAVFNIIFMFSRILEVLHASSLAPLSWLEPLFWKSRPYMMMISNISGTMSTWLTLMVTVETVMCIMMPFVFRKYCTKRLTWIFLITSLIIASALHTTILWVTDVEEHVKVKTYVPNFKLENTSCWFLQSVFRVRNNPQFEIWRRFYTTITMAVSIVIPTVAMLVCSILITKHYSLKDLGEAFSQRRRCVIRMTVATTISHLLLEGPATLTHAASAIKGEDYSYLMCLMNHGNNFLSLFNATIPFFVFLIYNQQFRHMTIMYIKAIAQKDQAKRKSYFSQAGMRCGRMSRIETDCSFAETRLVSRRSNV
ncbi:unnamed protein product [Caenorhabditis bovis]|uniref:G-protein coupled receptors family 1 profile domain-containing protein n=1 Tax=Caenorhabditis bovis TaxID=2654633 RepID=A0A8S1EMT7_9PELO|nr:unnamed protein product [Caenorhabditis bovis]